MNLIATKKIFPKAQRIRELMLVIAIAFLNIIFSIRNNAHNFLEGIFFSRITSQVNSSQWVSSWQGQAMIGLESDKDDLGSSYIRVQLYICCPAVSGQNSGSWRAHAWKGLVFDVTVVLSVFFLIDALGSTGAIINTTLKPLPPLSSSRPDRCFNDHRHLFVRPFLFWN